MASQANYAGCDKPMQKTKGMTERSIQETSELYRAALIKEDWQEFKDSCQHDTGGILPMSLACDTPLHLAVFSGKRKPLEDLLDAIPLKGDACMIKNQYGNTALHNAAITGNFEAVKLLVSTNSDLLEITNDVGETPLFKAAAFGWTKIVKHLASQHGQIKDNQLLPIHRRRQEENSIDPKDPRTTSILHIAVEGEHFDTALQLLKLDKSLGQLEDKHDMTCLQRLATVPSAFKSGYRMGTLESFPYLCLPIYEDEDDENDAVKKHLCLGLPTIKRIWKAKRKHELALKLAKKLIKEDYSWLNNHTMTDDSSLSYSNVGVEEEEDEEKGKRQCESETPSAKGQGESQSKTQNKTETQTPLLLATRNGIQEIVKEILKTFPQAVDHCSTMGQNILLLAVKYRQKEIFDLVKDMKVPIGVLARGIDRNGYTLLHHAARLATEETRPGPALQLQADLEWFRYVEKLVPTHYARHIDKKSNLTAEQLFKKNHGELLKKAQKWIKETSQSCSAVAVLIATVVFAAAYTVPGGSNAQGIPVFLNSPFFLFFTIMDVASLASSLTSVVMFLSILTSPCELEDFHHSLPRKLMIGFSLLFFSVTTTMLAFAATLVLIIRLNHEQWTTTLIYVAAFFPVTVFALMQFPLYTALYAAFMGTLKGSFKQVMEFVSTTAMHVFKPKKKLSTNMV